MDRAGANLVIATQTFPVRARELGTRPDLSRLSILDAYAYAYASRIDSGAGEGSSLDQEPLSAVRSLPTAAECAVDLDEREELIELSRDERVFGREE